MRKVHARRNICMLLRLHNLMAHSFLLILLFFSIMSTNTHACHRFECSSLLSFAPALSSPSLNWTSVNCCRWKGITCNQDGWVTELLLPSKGLNSGTFLSSLGNLTHLTHLNLSHNSLYGSLVTEVFLSLKRLEILDLSYNLFFGKLPFSLLSSHIRIVNLSNNRFHGAVPSSYFTHASNLTSFNVSNNTFSGYIPSSICLHSSPMIRLLDFSVNNFSGNISPGLGECSKLQIFRASNNNLSGLLPKDIYNATKLKEIALPSNSLHGEISERIANLTNLVILDLSFNQLSGVLPHHFGKLFKLKFVNLDFNYLEGSLPLSLMNCTDLVELHMLSNNLEGNISALDFSRLSYLTRLDLRANNLTGTLPISLYSCRSLEAIGLSRNHLEGQILPDIVSLKSLSFLSLSYNQLTNVTGSMRILMGCKNLRTLLLSGSFKGEAIPSNEDMPDFDRLQNLKFLALAQSDLFGRIPEWLSKLKNLEVLELNNNRITGPIPSWLGNLPRLRMIDFHNNLITGEFPKELRTLPSLVSEPPAAHYYLELPVFNGHPAGSFFSSLRTLSYFPVGIVLNDNRMSGNIPTEICQLTLLQVLELGTNNFSGGIPDQIGNLKALERVDLSANDLSGKLPSSLASLNFLKEFNVSYNNLEGPIPTSTQLQSFDASAFEGNPKLCSLPLPVKCQLNKGIDADDKNDEGADNEHQFPWFYMFLALGFIVGFWGVCGSMIIMKTWRYAYFQFLDDVQDRLYVMIIVRITRIKRRLRG